MTSTPTRPVDNVVIATKGLQDRNINTQAGTTVEIKGKNFHILLNGVFPHFRLFKQNRHVCLYYPFNEYKN